MTLNSLPADVIRAVISFVGRDAAIDGNFTIDSSLWNVARGWDDHIAESRGTARRVEAKVHALLARPRAP